MEQGGIPIKSILCKKSPAEINECGKTDCPICRGEKSKGKNCLKVTQGGAGYTIRCTTCKDKKKKKSVYHGETERTLYTRLKEHAKAHQMKHEGNALYKHDQMEHDCEKAEYCFEPIKLFRDPLTRQINEGVRINQSLADEQCIFLNSRAEFMQGTVPRVEIVLGPHE